MQKLCQGAEAVITRDGDAVRKKRIKKGYRIEQIDINIRKKRTRLEARLLREARRAGLLTPQILEEEKFMIKMEFIDGRRLKDVIDAGNHKILSEKIGECVAKLHNYNIIHGDLTTSNMMLRVREKDELIHDVHDTKSKKITAPYGSDNFDIYFIDFGLGFFSRRPEDKATDLHLLKEAIESTHFEFLESMWKTAVQSYKKHYSGADKVIKALSKIEKRGRYRERQK